MSRPDRLGRAGTPAPQARTQAPATCQGLAWAILTLVTGSVDADHAGPGTDDLLAVDAHREMGVGVPMKPWSVGHARARRMRLANQARDGKLMAARASRSNCASRKDPFRGRRDALLAARWQVAMPMAKKFPNRPHWQGQRLARP